MATTASVSHPAFSRGNGPDCHLCFPLGEFRIRVYASKRYGGRRCTASGVAGREALFEARKVASSSAVPVERAAR